MFKGGGGGRTRANSVCFTKNVVKIGAFPNATPTSKIWKNLSVDQKDQRRRSVWVGHADFSKIANDNIVSGTHVTACQQQTEYYAFSSLELVSLNVTFVKS